MCTPSYNWGCGCVQNEPIPFKLILNSSQYSRILCMFGLWGRAARRKPFLMMKNIHAWLDFAKTLIKSQKSVWVNVLLSKETKVELFGISPPKQHTHSEAWWGQHDALGLFFFSLSQGWRNSEQFTTQFWHKTFKFPLKSWRWRGISPFSMTKTTSIHPNQQKHGFTRRR